MTFYDSERIVRKNEKYEKTKAYAAISKLENKGLSVSEMIEALDILLKDQNTESQQSILERAKKILESRKESDCEENSDENDTGLEYFRDVCPLISSQRQL